MGPARQDCHPERSEGSQSEILRGAQHDTVGRSHGKVYECYALWFSALTSAQGFTVTAGEASLTRYKSSPGKRRCFCQHCGSHVFAYYNNDPSVIVLRLGTVENFPAQRPLAHIWVRHKALWYEILDDTPQFEEDYAEG